MGLWPLEKGPRHEETRGTTTHSSPRHDVRGGRNPRRPPGDHARRGRSASRASSCSRSTFALNIVAVADSDTARRWQTRAGPRHSGVRDRRRRHRLPSRSSATTSAPGWLRWPPFWACFPWPCCCRRSHWASSDLARARPGEKVRAPSRISSPPGPRSSLLPTPWSNRKTRGSGGGGRTFRTNSSWRRPLAVEQVCTQLLSWLAVPGPARVERGERQVQVQVRPFPALVPRLHQRTPRDEGWQAVG